MGCPDKSLKIDNMGAANEALRKYHRKRRKTSPIPLKRRRYIHAREGRKGVSSTVTPTVKRGSRTPSHMGSSYILSYDELYYCHCPNSLIFNNRIRTPPCPQAAWGPCCAKIVPLTEHGSICDVGGRFSAPAVILTQHKLHSSWGNIGRSGEGGH